MRTTAPFYFFLDAQDRQEIFVQVAHETSQKGVNEERGVETPLLLHVSRTFRSPLLLLDVS